ncbi:hypothetical protein J6590_080900 [Homalodisca vitripennis]|nr:hypothetical protein J6590_081899 [Homalodisca vitripennis]KAG8285404.1 hypothetical protein J6590_080900 [Homalodisca vitripennis]
MLHGDSTYSTISVHFVEWRQSTKYTRKCLLLWEHVYSITRDCLLAPSDWSVTDGAGLWSNGAIQWDIFARFSPGTVPQWESCRSLLYQDAWNSVY